MSCANPACWVIGSSLMLRAAVSSSNRLRDCKSGITRCAGVDEVVDIELRGSIKTYFLAGL